MGLVKIIDSKEFFADPGNFLSGRGGNDSEQAAVYDVVDRIISAVRSDGDNAVRRYTEYYDKAVLVNFEVPFLAAREAWENLSKIEPALASSLSLAADNIRRFGELQKEQLISFESEIKPGIFSGQRVIPVNRAAIYVPAGRFPLISSVLMGLIPAAVAGVREKLLVSPPREGGIPDRRILAAGFIAGADRIFAMGGAQAIAALALGTETIPRADLIAGPGNKYVAAAKRLLYGEVGIDLVAGPTDVLVITDISAGAEYSGCDAANAADLIAESADLIAADLLAQAEHDPDACARALVPDMEMAKQIEAALAKRLAGLPAAETARTSLNAGGLIIVYGTRDEAIEAANRIAPEHLELHVSCTGEWMDGLENYGSLFIGASAAEVLGDYSAGINHTLPTSGSARFTGGLSVRNFLKTVTTLRCDSGKGYAQALFAAETIARAEGLAGHAESAASRINSVKM